MAKALTGTALANYEAAAAASEAYNEQFTEFETSTGDVGVGADVTTPGQVNLASDSGATETVQSSGTGAGTVISSSPGTGPVPVPVPNPNPAPAPAPTPTTTTPPPTGETGVPDSTSLQSASAIVDAFLASIPGLAQLDPSGIFTAWVNTYMGQLAGQGLSSSDIVSTLEATMNTPGAASEGANAGAQAVFDAVFPGYNAKIAAGTTNADGSYTGIAGYIQYSAQIQQFATQAGLVNGTITQQDIGNLWAGNVSSNEVSQRITDATVAATSAPQAVQDYLAQNYGMTPGALTSYYLNPQNTLQTITQNLNAGMVGGAAAATGFDQALSTAQAASLGAFLSSSTSSGNGSQVGGVNQIGYQQAANAFASGLGTNNAGGSLGSAAQMANAGYTTANLPGQVGGTVSENTLIGAIEGNASALQQTQQAEQTRTAGSRGGGGATTTSRGAVGLGFASEG